MKPPLTFLITIGFISILLILGCEDKSSEIQLDHYGAFENIELTIEIENAVDSLDLNIWHYQELYGALEFDTILRPSSGKITMRKKITLERPTPVAIQIDSISSEVFLIPGLKNDFKISLIHSPPEIKFANSDMQHINEYYWQKAEIGGDMYMRPILTKFMTLPFQKEAQDSMHILHSTLLHNLENKAKEYGLPVWFVDFEKKDLEYFMVTAVSSIPVVRKRVFGIKDSSDIVPDLKDLSFDPEDESALVTQSFLESLPQLLSAHISPGTQSDPEPAERILLYYEKSELLKNVHIKDVFRSKLLLTMLRSSISFPDSLIMLVEKGISEKMKAYVELVEAKYNQFNGTPAPPIYLADANDNMVSLKDFRGNLVLLDFWFVGCRLCRAELPYTKNLFDHFRDKNFKVLQICMKSDRNEWEKLKADFIGMPLYSNPGWDKKLTNDYKIQGYPRYVLIDDQGTILEGWCERPSDPALKDRITNYFESN